MERTDWNFPGSSGPKYDPTAFARMLEDSYNNMVGKLTDYDCPKCRNRGDFVHVQVNGNRSFTPCDCMELRRCIGRMKASGLGDALEWMTFDNFAAREDWQKGLLDVAKRYAENPRGWLFLSGQPGCGKTHLCTAVCRELLRKGMTVRYLPWQDEMATLRFRDGETREDRLRELKNVPVLYIDDFLKTTAERPSAWETNTAYSLLNARYSARMPTILSCEYGLDALMAIDEALAGRIGQRSRNSCLHVRADVRRDYRLRCDV